MPLYDKRPFVEEGTFVAPSASVIGNVDLGEKSAVWYGAVLRGDVNSIKVGNFTSLGDRVVVHVAKENPNGPHPTIIGDHVVVEQGAILHACTLEDESLVCPLLLPPLHLPLYYFFTHIFPTIFISILLPKKINNNNNGVVSKKKKERVQRR